MTVAGETSDASLTAAVRTQLLRVVQEALANVQWHADAHPVSVSLARDGEAVCLRL